MEKRVLLKDIQNNELYPRACMPIGSVIFLNNTLDPNTYFMGTWQKIEGEVFFMTSSSNFPVGQVSGSNEHTLTIEEIPAHNHGISWNYDNEKGSMTGIHGGQRYGGQNFQNSEENGGGQPFDIKPKRYTINAWVRTA